MSPKPQAGAPPLVGCPRLLIQYIRSYPLYLRPFLHPQTEDAPCRGYRYPRFMENVQCLYPLLKKISENCVFQTFIYLVI